MRKWWTGTVGAALKLAVWDVRKDISSLWSQIFWLLISWKVLYSWVLRLMWALHFTGLFCTFHWIMYVTVLYKQSHTHMNVLCIICYHLTLSTNSYDFRNLKLYFPGKRLLCNLCDVPWLHIIYCVIIPGQKIWQREAEEGRKLLSVLRRWVLFSFPSWFLFSLALCSKGLRQPLKSWEEYLWW